MRLAVSIGCPSGIGPEVSVVAAAAERSGRVLLVGDEKVLRGAAGVRGLDPARFVRVNEPAEAWTLPRKRIAIWQPTAPLAARDHAPGRPTRAGGAAQLAWVDAACDLVARGGADAMVTGPVSKDVIVRSGAPGSAEFLGHTEHLQRRLHAREVVMAFWSAKLTTALVTTHLALADVPRAITPAAVARATYWLAWLMAKLASRPPRIAVAGLNPHAGEAGLLGHEEPRRIVPGLGRARARLEKAGVRADLVGPVPAESAFRLAADGQFDAVVAMYHDQATIPMKLVGFGEAVNVSLGLPILRTSVDHGTAYDRAGKGTADARAMKEAMGLAVRLGGEAQPATTRSSGSRSRSSRARRSSS
jgi:4-hydroxythreonine-4-phosphate dehydrogenase